MTAAQRAPEFVNDGDRVGLGTGRAAFAFVRALLRERVVATVSRRLIILADLVLTEQDGQVQERRRPDMRGRP